MRQFNPQCKLCHKLPWDAEGPPRLSSFGRTLEETRAIVASLQTGLHFIRVLSQSLATVTQLLASSTMTDVQEAITLLIYCHKFQVQPSDKLCSVSGGFQGCSSGHAALLRASASDIPWQQAQLKSCCLSQLTQHSQDPPPDQALKNLSYSQADTSCCSCRLKGPKQPCAGCCL